MFPFWPLAFCSLRWSCSLSFYRAPCFTFNEEICPPSIVLVTIETNSHKGLGPQSFIFAKSKHELRGPYKYPKKNLFPWASQEDLVANSLGESQNCFPFSFDAKEKNTRHELKSKKSLKFKSVLPSWLGLLYTLKCTFKSQSRNAQWEAENSKLETEHRKAFQDKITSL